MISKKSRISRGIKVFTELGPIQSGLFAWYQFGLRSGYLRRKSDLDQKHLSAYHDPYPLRMILTLPKSDTIREIVGGDRIDLLIAEADDIVGGKVRLFGGDPIPFSNFQGNDHQHWTDYERYGYQASVSSDIKYIWEPARFGWVYPLGRAYLLTNDECYPAAFWHYTTQFLDENPPNQGLNWTSAQEVALRLIAFVFAAQIFNNSLESTEERKNMLARAVARHAVRIPATISYARAQNNNHLLSEAAGLYTAGVALADHPEAKHWQDLGWKWFNKGLALQIAEDGTYIQQSTNYHRLMLQLAMWVNLVGKVCDMQFSSRVKERLALATAWLLSICDRPSGRVPNLGPNDGAYIFPFSECSFEDYRPVLQSAGKLFLDLKPFGSGPWNEMLVWFESPEIQVRSNSSNNQSVYLAMSNLIETPHILRYPGGDTWAYLRAAKIKSRPGHADQLHMDLWWRGINVAMDAGTYQYNAAPPWDNTLTSTIVHNTISVDGRDQMTRAGLFLYLDWAQADVIEGDRNIDRSWRRIVVEHNGYRGIGLIHRRSVFVQKDRVWIIKDSITNLAAKDRFKDRSFDICLHWLCPDWNWNIKGNSLLFDSPYGEIELKITVVQESCKVSYQIMRAGKIIYGSGDDVAFLGWYSPTYGTKIPALSIRISVYCRVPVSIKSVWKFPESE